MLLLLPWLQGLLGEFLLRGEDTGDIGLFFCPQPPEPEVEEEPQPVLSDAMPIARSTDLLKRSPIVDFFTPLG